MRLSDLPDTLLTDVGSYLPAPSRALLAVAITFQEDRKPPASGDAIAFALLGGEQWEVLDFGDIEKSLASRLTDDHIRDVLIIAANLKRLKLAGCMNITGKGLEPLRGSTVIEQIDISLVGVHERTDIGPAKISEADDVPILESIVNVQGCSLKHVQLSKKFRSSLLSYMELRGKIGRRAAIPPVYRFVTSYNQLLQRRAFSCSSCPIAFDTNSNAPHYAWPKIIDAPPCAVFVGVQDNTCCICTSNFCNNCRGRDAGRGSNRSKGGYLCSKCERCYCVGCAIVETCEDCNDAFVCTACEEIAECQTCMKWKARAERAKEDMKLFRVSLHT